MFVLLLGGSAAGLQALSTEGSHQFMLNASALYRGSGSRLSGTTRLMHKLENGKAISVGILGASVGQNGGCLTQVDNRCIEKDGIRNTTMAWGEPRIRPHAGFLVRWFRWLNATWPASGGTHTLHNGARDANSLQTIAPCIFTHVPPKVDLVIIEAGSMFLTQDVATVERLTRQLLASHSKPVIAFLNIHIWCTFGGSLKKKTLSSGISSLPSRAYGFFKNASYGLLQDSPPEENFEPPKYYARSRSDTLEDRINQICAHYQVSCISQRDALTEGFLKGWPGFAPTDIAGDCLHPTHGRLGTEYMTDLLIDWTRRAQLQYQLEHPRHNRIERPSRVGALSAGIRASQEEKPDEHPLMRQSDDLDLLPHHLIPSRNMSTQGIHDDLPAPLWQSDATVQAACFTLAQSDGGVQYHGHTGNRLPWQTASCAMDDEDDGLGPSDTITSRRTPFRERVETNPEAAAFNHCVRPANDPVCPAKKSSSRIEPVIHANFPYWAFCEDLFGKVSPAVTAFASGATLLVPLPTDWLPYTKTSLVSFNITLQYLESWERMGQLSVVCIGSCICNNLVIDAHMIHKERKVSIFTEYTFPVVHDQRRADTLAAGSTVRTPCGLRLRVRNQTSSEGHLFRVRDIISFLGSSPCHIDAMKRFVAIRSNLVCV